MSWDTTTFVELVRTDGTHVFINPDYVYKVEPDPTDKHVCTIYIDTTESYQIKGSAAQVASILAS